MRAFAVATAMAALALAGPAHAASLSANYSAGTLTYNAAAGEKNNVSISDATAAYLLQDSAQSALSLVVIGGGGCTSVQAWKFRCVSLGIGKLVVNLGDGNDTLDARETALPTTVTAGAGQKSIDTGSANDTIDAANGYADHISCGAGEDVVHADATDKVADDCEQVSADGSFVGTGALPPGAVGGSSGSAGATGTAGQSTSTGSAGGQASNISSLEAPIGLRLPSNPVALQSPRRAVVTVGCSASAPDDCRGDIYIDAAAALGAAARGHYVTQQRRIAHRKFNIRRGKTAKIGMRIAFRGHYAQVVRRRRGIRATLRIVTRDSAGNVVGMSSRPVTLHAAASKWSRKRPYRRPVRH